MNPEDDQDNPLRRKHPRTPHVSRLHILLPGEAETPEDLMGSVVDVSPEGLGVLTSKAIPDGHTVQVVMDGPSLGLPVNLRGTVRWCKDEGEDTYFLGIRLHEEELPLWHDILLDTV